MSYNYVSDALRDTLLEFTMTSLLYQPTALVSYAEKYFNELKALRKTPIEYDLKVVRVESMLYDESDESVVPEPRATRRIAVSGESYDPRKAVEDFVKPVYKKTDEERRTLKAVTNHTLLFRNLDEEQLEDILNAVFKRHVTPGEVIIEQGEDGDNFYVIEQGNFSVFQTDSNGRRQFIHTYQHSGFFGELALLYNQPRAATVVAESEGIIWALDRKTFRYIVVQSAVERRTRYEEFIESIPMLEVLSSYEKNLLVDAFVPKKISGGEEIYAGKDTADGR